MSKESPITYADKWFVNEDKILEFTVVDADEVAIDISTYTLSWELKEEENSSDNLISKTTGSGISLVTDGSDGKCQVAIDAADTASLVAGKYWHELRRTGTGTGGVLSFGNAVLRGA